MTSLPSRLSIPAGVLGLALMVSEAQAASVTVYCPGSASTTDREFSVTTDPGTATCILFGAGNLNGNNDPVNQLAPGYLTLDKSDDLLSGVLPGSLTATPPTSGLSGTFSITAPGYTDFIIAFKTGEGQIDPDWAAFRLPAGVTSGSWSISGQQEMSHSILYGRLTPVPLPAAAWLLLSGVAGLGALARRRRAAEPA
jgi:hypothetical protein